MRPVVDETSDVVLGHLRKLFLEDTLQASKNNERLAVAVVVDHAEFDLAIPLFDDSGLSRNESAHSDQRFAGASPPRRTFRIEVLTFSGKGIGFTAGFLSGSAESLCLTRFVAAGDDGSSIALRFASAD